jgi:uncharacterized protein (DUF885 family)
MTRVSHSLLCGLVLLVFAGCGRSPPHTTAAPAPTTAPPEQLGRIVERYWDGHLSPENALSPQFLADSLNIERRYLAEVLTVPREHLDAASRLTYDIFRRQREVIIEGFTFPAELLPINPFGGVPQQFAASAADTAQYPLANVAAYENWLRRIDEYVRWTQQAMTNMREGVRRGYTSPRVLIERMLPILERFGDDNAANVFYAPLHSMPEAIKDPERSRLTKMVSGATSGKLLPANRLLHDFLLNEYLPRARTGIALSDLPLGAGWYAYRVKRATGTALSADEIHRIGVAEVERMGARLQPLRETAAAAVVPLAGNQLLDAYKDLAAQVRTAIPSLFSETPSADFDFQGVDSLREPAASLSYRWPGPAGIPPALLYVNIGDTAVRAVSISSFLQEALPGHYYQIAIQQERVDLPRFRRFGAEPAFVEGWGLYAASLGEELGLYTDEAAKSDAAAGEMRCAVALVVDTGLHAKGWTPAVALEYLRTHLLIDDLAAKSLIDWYAANPADALACMMGKMRFRAIRAHAQQLLGGRFDIREFHSEILQGGAMPLDILEATMKVRMDALP